MCLCSLSSSFLQYLNNPSFVASLSLFFFYLPFYWLPIPLYSLSPEHLKVDTKHSHFKKENINWICFFIQWTVWSTQFVWPLYNNWCWSSLFSETASFLHWHDPLPSIIANLCLLILNLVHNASFFNPPLSVDFSRLHSWLSFLCLFCVPVSDLTPTHGFSYPLHPDDDRLHI